MNKQNDSAEFVLSKKDCLDQYNKLKEFCDVISYSAKTNYEVANVLEEETNCFFSIHSIESTSKIKDKSRIWFFSQGWQFEELKKLIETGITNFIVDNENDLDILLKFLQDKKESLNNKKINLLLRIKLSEHTIHTGKYYVYGMYSEQVKKLIPKLRKNDLIDKLGIHFHRKTQNISEWSLKYELEDILTEDILNSIDIINIGGGLPARYKNFRAKVLPYIFSEIKTLRSWLTKHNIQMIIEPGRFIAAPAVKLVTTIKNIYDNNIIVDCSIYNSSMDTFVAHTRLEIEDEYDERTAQKEKSFRSVPQEYKPYTVKGKTPCSMDIFRYKVFLKEKKVGDKLIFLNAGAYNFSTEFCNLEKIKTRII